MILEPIGDNIVVELPQEEERENKTSSGIVLPKKNRKRSSKRYCKSSRCRNRKNT